MRRLAIMMFAAAVPISAADAQTMPLSQFLTKADELEKKGALALFSGDIAILKREVQNSGKQLRAEQVAAQKAGRKPATCMPAQASMNSTELLAHFRSIPPQQRAMPVKAALASLMRKKYPCPA